MKPGDGWLRALGERLLRLPRAASWALVLAWYALITWFSSLPGSDVPQPWYVNVLHNAAHAPLFGLLATWMTLLVRRNDGWPDLSAVRRVGVLATVLGLAVADELHQGLLSVHRDLSALDVLTDVCGAAVSLEIVAHLGREARSRAGLGLRLALALTVSLACGALATFLPRCFPSVSWL